MFNRFLRIVVLVIWLELGLMLILLPWSEIWEANYFLYQYPPLGFSLIILSSRGDFGLGVHERASLGGSISPAVPWPRVAVEVLLRNLRDGPATGHSNDGSAPVIFYVTDRKSQPGASRAGLEAIRTAAAAKVDFVQIRRKGIADPRIV